MERISERRHRVDTSAVSALQRIPVGLVVGLAAGLGACATTKTAPKPEASPHVKMAPILVHSEKDPLTGLDGYDAEQLLELGNQLHAKAEYDKAVKVFDRLISAFPKSELVASAIYNSGLSFEKLVELDKALERYKKVVADHRDSSSFKDAYFRVSFMLSKLKRWEEVANTFWAIRHLDNLTPMDELEARVGMGVGMFMQKDYATAEREFLHALSFHRKHSKMEYLPADYYVGQSRFYLGEIYAREFESTKLSPPKANEETWVEMMGRELEKKCEILLRAQNNFIRTIRVGHTGWATAAGFRIGSLYQTLYEDLVNLPVPPSLDSDSQELYSKELRKRVSVLVLKAIQVYERSLQMAQRVGEKNEWVEKTSESLERMKTLYLEAMKDEDEGEANTET